MLEMKILFVLNFIRNGNRDALITVVITTDEAQNEAISRC